MELAHRFVETNGIRMHIAEQGAGPLVVLCHGFPESWYSWRHQLPALAAAGFHAVAPDMRGYGQTDRPEAIDQYTQLHMVGDIVGLLDALGAETAVIAGHDWGAPVAWNAALMRPDRFRAVVGLSVPYLPRGSVRPNVAARNTTDRVFYQSYFQEPGVAEAEFERDVRTTMLRFLWLLAGERPPEPGDPLMAPRNGGLLDLTDDPRTPPSWLTAADLDFYTAEFTRTGFRGGLNWYRNTDRTWELLAPFAGAKVRQPALFIAGDRDVVLAFRGARGMVEQLPAAVPNLRRSLILPGCGHWTQQERPAETSAAMIDFLKGL